MTEINSENILLYLDAATPDEIQEGLTWYSDAREICEGWSAQYDVSVKQAAYAIAALSPRTPWDNNLIFAEAVLKGVNAGHLPSQIKADGARTFSSAVALAWAIVKFKDYALLVGQKVSSFVHNILFETSGEVTIDVWANRIARNDLHTSINITDVRYGQAVEAYREALAIALARPEPIEGLKYAYQLQAITWVTARRLSAEGTATL